MTRFGRVDRTQNEIVEGLRQAHAVVVVLSRVGQGVPDLMVGFRRAWYLIECKSKVGRFTQDEDEFRLMCVVSELPYAVARTPEEALRAIGAIR